MSSFSGMLGTKRHKFRKLAQNANINSFRIFLEQFLSPVGNYEVRATGLFDGASFRARLRGLSSIPRGSAKPPEPRIKLQN